MNHLILLSYQTRDRKSTGFLHNTKKTIQRPQTKRARDPKSSYNSSILNKAQKVNRIFIQYKKGDSSTANHPARDHESPYTSILPNPEQKVKPLAKYLLLHFVSIWGILILRNIYK